MSPFDPSMERPAQFNATGTYNKPQPGILAAPKPVAPAKVGVAPPLPANPAEPYVATKFIGTPMGTPGQYAPKPAPAAPAVQPMKPLPSMNPQDAAALTAFMKGPSKMSEPASAKAPASSSPSAAPAVNINDRAGIQGMWDTAIGKPATAGMEPFKPQPGVMGAGDSGGFTTLPFQTQPGIQGHAAPPVPDTSDAEEPSAEPQPGISLGTREHPLTGTPRAPVSPQQYQMHLADQLRHQQMAEAHNAIMSMAKGKNGQYGNLMHDSVPYTAHDQYGDGSGYQDVPGEGLNKAMAAMQAHYASLAQGDAHEHGAEIQFGGDIKHDPAYRAAQIGHLTADADHARAQAAALDPVAEEARMKRIMADPALRSAYEAKIGVAPGTIQSPPVASVGPNGQANPAFHVGNVDQGLARPENSGLAGILATPNMSFQEKLQRASQIPDFADPNSQTRQLFNAHMHQLFPSQNDWQSHRESHPAIGPDQWKTPIPLGPLKEWVGGPAQAIIGAMTGQPTGTGWNWRKNYDDGQQEDAMINKYGIKY